MPWHPPREMFTLLVRPVLLLDLRCPIADSDQIAAMAAPHAGLLLP